MLLNQIRIYKLKQYIIIIMIVHFKVKLMIHLTLLVFIIPICFSLFLYLSLI